MQSKSQTGKEALLPLLPQDQYAASFWQHWRTQLRWVLPKPWLASSWLKQSRTLLARFSRNYSQLCRQPRPVRRRLQRQLGMTLTGVALALALANVPVQAADFTAYDQPTLVAAINAANDEATNAGPDTITLTADVTETIGVADIISTGSFSVGLPIITSAITIEGAGHKITRDPNATDDFGLLSIAPGGDLTLHQTTLSGGASFAGTVVNYGGGLTLNQSTITGSYGLVGAIFNFPTSTLAINDTTFTNNLGIKYGSAVFNAGTATISNSTVMTNATVLGGGAIVNFAGGTISVADSTVANNTAKYGNGGGFINNTGTLTITNSLIENNVAPGQESGGGLGGALYNQDGIVTIIDTTISGNSSGFSGGAIFNHASSTPTSAASVHKRNARAAANQLKVPAALAAKLKARGLDISKWQGLAGKMSLLKAAQTTSTATLTLLNSTVNNNTAGINTGTGRTDDDDGGGIFNVGGDLILTNSTVSENQAPNNTGDFHGLGGGIYNTYGGTLVLNNSTLTGNMAGQAGGAIYNAYDSAGMTLSRTIVSGNTALEAAEIDNYANGSTIAPVTVDADNLFGSSSLTNAQAFSGTNASFIPGASDITATSDGTLPKALADILDPTLADNGGKTKTHALVAGSPAIDAAGDSGLATDQRGITRPQGNADDIGSVESSWTKVTSNLAIQGGLTTNYTATPDGTYGAQSPAGIYTIDAIFRNTANPEVKLQDVFFKVRTLESINNVANYLLNADGGPGQVGSTLSIANSALGTDHLWNQSEDLPVTFQIGLMERRRFSFFVDVYAISGVTAARKGAVQYLGTFQFTFDPNNTMRTIFLPMVQR